MFGTGARADLLTFFLTHPKSDYAASDVVEIGYSKRNLADILDELSICKLFDRFMVGNQQRYRLIKNDQLAKILGPIPTYSPSWGIIFEILLQLRCCIHRTEKMSDSSKVVEIRNLLLSFQEQLTRLQLTPPPSWQNNASAYLDAFSEWLLELARKLAHGDFPDHHFLKLC